MAKSPIVTIYNCGTQMIPLQVRTPGGDFFLSEQQIQLLPGKSVELPESHVSESQLANLQGKGLLKVTVKTE